MNKFLKVPLLALAMAPALPCVTAAAADAASDATVTTLHTAVRFPDLNLQSREGATVLYKRIAHAANTMCAPSREMLTLGITAMVAAQVHDCKLQAIERAVTQIDAPTLTAVFNDRMHRKSEPIRLVQAH
jgi:UrcA family protein